jgi:hypothetical protein
MSYPLMIDCPAWERPTTIPIQKRGSGKRNFRWLRPLDMPIAWPHQLRTSALRWVAFFMFLRATSLIDLLQWHIAPGVNLQPAAGEPRSKVNWQLCCPPSFHPVKPGVGALAWR